MLIRKVEVEAFSIACTHTNGKPRSLAYYNNMLHSSRGCTYACLLHDTDMLACFTVLPEAVAPTCIFAIPLLSVSSKAHA